MDSTADVMEIKILNTLKMRTGFPHEKLLISYWEDMEWEN